jgi:hypothetical protein
MAFTREDQINALRAAGWDIRPAITSLDELPPVPIKFYVELRSPVLWLTATGKWSDNPDHIQYFDTFAAAEAASGTYDVIIRTTR